MRSLEMTKRSATAQRLLLDSIAPVLCSLIVGFVFFQQYEFELRSPAFQFLLSGVIAAVFYNLLNLTNNRTAFAGLIVLFFLTLLTTGSSSAEYILRDVFYVAGIGASVFICHSVFRQSQSIHPAYAPFLMAGIYGIVNIVANGIHLLLVRGFSLFEAGRTIVSLAETSAFFGVLVGFGVGAGISITNKLRSA